VAAGEPPGRWYGRGAAALGLAGEVDAQDMTALYEHFLDPRDEAFSDPERWADAATLGHTGRRYLSEEEIYATVLAAEPDADAERRAELRVEAGKKALKTSHSWMRRSRCRSRSRCCTPHSRARR
jgi:TrwC relaxase